MTKLLKCPVCQGVSFRKKLSCKDYTYSKETFKVVSCETCWFAFTNPRPKDDEIGKYYCSEMYISHTNNTEGVFNLIYQAVRKLSIRAKVSLLKGLHPRGTHLDIGCGTGEFLNACRDAGFKTKGIEPSETARKQAIENYNLSVSENTNLEKYLNDEIGSVSMWHVLEHVTNLNETISQIYRIVKPQGKVIVAVPNYKCWDAAYYKEHWAAWDVPIHLWHFSEKTIKQIFSKHGFELIKTKPMLFDSYYISILSEEFRYGRKNFLKSILIGTISNIIGIISNRGCSSTTYIFEKTI